MKLLFFFKQLHCRTCGGFRTSQLPTEGLRASIKASICESAETQQRQREIGTRELSQRDPSKDNTFPVVSFVRSCSWTCVSENDVLREFRLSFSERTSCPDFEIYSFNIQRSCFFDTQRGYRMLFSDLLIYFEETTKFIIVLSFRQCWSDSCKMSDLAFVVWKHMFVKYRRNYQRVEAVLSGEKEGYGIQKYSWRIH